MNRREINGNIASVSTEVNIGMVGHVDHGGGGDKGSFRSLDRHAFRGKEPE